MVPIGAFSLTFAVSNKSNGYFELKQPLSPSKTQSVSCDFIFYKQWITWTDALVISILSKTPFTEQIAGNLHSKKYTFLEAQ